MENRVGASLLPSDREAIHTAIATIKERLPFLIDLSNEEPQD
ncbi:hypothetical protein [Neosynechococcus sphagnicola]|nr:hypothetical protein [Neosynechococcus sphagnicola]